LEPWHYFLAIIAGFVAGIINTLAGSGSLFTLPFLLFMGLPAQIANGTNRVGILLQTLVGASRLYRKSDNNLKHDLRYILPCAAGSAVGALIAVSISEDAMRITIGVVMLLLLLVMLSNYNSLLKENDQPIPAHRKNIGMLLLFIIGIYGGFIQLGVGIFLLSLLLLYLQFTFKHANALKNSINFFLTVPAFIIFAINDQVNWELGGILAIGQMSGAWVASGFAAENKQANLWIRRLLVAMTLFSALKLLHVI
jgi:uncharacterized protein